jgi:hypothetical protein
MLNFCLHYAKAFAAFSAKVFARLFQKAARVKRRVAFVARRNGRNP